MRAAAGALMLLWAAAGDAQDARYLVRGGQLPVAVVANGYAQTVTPSDGDALVVEVATSVAPIGSRGTYGAMSTSGVTELPVGFQLPSRLGARLSPDLTAWEAATRVLEWSAAHLTVDAGDLQAQDAVSVLARGGGRCSGVANATTALLLAAGFDATTVSGLLMTDGGPIPHRWVACRLPEAGWVHTDPTLGLWTITPSHMAFAATVTELPHIQVLRRGADRIAVMPRRAGRPIRPDVGVELLCRVVGGDGGATVVAVLTGVDGEVHRTVLDPEGRFNALLPGRWRLVVTAQDRVVEDRQLLLRPGELHSYTVSLDSPTPAGGIGS